MKLVASSTLYYYRLSHHHAFIKCGVAHNRHSSFALLCVWHNADMAKLCMLSCNGMRVKALCCLLWGSQLYHQISL